MVQRLRDGVAITLITFLVVEVALRLAPWVIPPRLLMHFAPTARAEIAERRNLPTQRRTIEVQRDDGGPPLRVFQPNQQVNRLFDDRDAVDVVTTDENGFCNPPSYGAAQRRIGFVAIGDSFTWCTGVAPQDGWVSQLAQLSGVAGYNLGLGGIGPYEYLQLLEAYGLRLHPRIVLFNYYEGNDLRDALGYQRHVEGLDAHPNGAALAAPRLERTVKRFFATPVVNRSYALNLVMASGVELSVAREKSREPDQPIDFRYRLRSEREPVGFNLQNTDVDEVTHARALREGRIDLAVLENALARFVELADENGFEPVVLYTPSAYTAYGDSVEFDDPSLGELMSWFSRTQRDFLQSQGQALGYRFVDLTPALRAAATEHADRGLLYFPNNMHLSRLGNEVVAEELARVLDLRGPLFSAR